MPWDDPSGVRLRGWLGLSVHEFYDPQRVALVPIASERSMVPSNPWFEADVIPVVQERVREVVGRRR